MVAWLAKVNHNAIVVEAEDVQDALAALNVAWRFGGSDEVTDLSIRRMAADERFDFLPVVVTEEL